LKNGYCLHSSFGFAPFARYYALQFGNFSLYGQGELEFDFISSKTTIGDDTNKCPNHTRLGLNVFPGLSYKISDHVFLEADLNFFNFSVNRSIQKNQDGSDSRHVWNGIELNAGLDDVSTIGDLTIGAVVRF